MRVAAVLLSLCIGVGAAQAANSTFLLTITGPTAGTAAGLANQTVRETVNCKRRCEISTTVAIKPAVARRLGFRNVKPRQGWFTIGSSTVRPKARTATKIGFVLTPEARRLLPKAPVGTIIAGLVVATALEAPLGNFSTSWSFRLG